MKKTQIFSLILDCSGSMHELREEMYLSINQRIQSIKQLASDSNDEILLEISSFNHKLHTLVPLQDARRATLITLEDYRIEGSTALYDALGKTAQRLRDLQFGLLAGHEVRWTAVIYTDGFENSSTQFSLSDIQRLMSAVQEDPRSEVALVGCDSSTLETAQRMHLDVKNVVQTDRNRYVSSMEALDTFFEKRMNDESVQFNEVLENSKKTS